MAINSEKYKKLGDYSNSSAGESQSGPFVKIFISGEQRDEQDIRKFHAIYPDKWESKDLEEKYLLRNEDTINFIILFIKKIRVKREKRNRDYEEIVYFSYDPDNEQYPTGAKCEYLFAGALLDANFKPVKDKKDPDKPAMVVFRNDGVRVGPAVEYLNVLANKTSEMDALSDNQDFEKSVVTPRRFITQVKIGSRKTDYGNKNVYEYTPIKKLPDATVVGGDGKEGIMDKCMAWADIFDAQFDLSKKSKNVIQNQNTNTTDDTPSFQDDSNVCENSVESVEVDIDLGL